jgi:hypothetical protein
LKKLMLLAAMLAMVLAAAVPALAQYGDQDASGSKDTGVSQATSPVDSESKGDATMATVPAAADGSPEIAVPAPAGGDAGCSEDGGSVIAARDPKAGGSEDAGSVTLASTPGCSEITVPRPGQRW